MLRTALSLAQEQMRSCDKCWQPGPHWVTAAVLTGHAARGWGLFGAVNEATQEVHRSVCWWELFPSNHSNLTAGALGTGVWVTWSGVEVPTPH